MCCTNEKSGKRSLEEIHLRMLGSLCAHVAVLSWLARDRGQHEALDQSGNEDTNERLRQRSLGDNKHHNNFSQHCEFSATQHKIIAQLCATPPTTNSNAAQHSATHHNTPQHATQHTTTHHTTHHNNPKP